jgi:amino acid adenylation domain-containing protein
MRTLLTTLKKNNISIALSNGDLKVKFNGNKIPDEIVMELKAHKEELVKYLNGIQKQNAEVAIQPLPPQDNYILSSSQQRIWILSQFEEANLAYNMPAVYVFEGTLDTGCLEKAFLTLIARHEILRTVFKEDEQGDVKQFVRPFEEIGFAMQQNDLREKADRDHLLMKYVDSTIDTPFNLSTGPLLRANLFRLETRKWVLSFAMHHIISDGWSLGLLIKELLSQYNTFVQGEQSVLAPLRIQYKDYAAWQQHQLSNENLETHKSYWLNQFSGMLPVLELLPDKARPAVKTYNGGIVGKYISKEMTGGIKQLAQQHGATLFMELTAVVNTLLHLYTGQEDVILGSPIAGREHSDLEDQIGLYLNTIVLRTRFKKEESFSSLVKNVKAVTLGAYEHQVFPFDELVENLNLKRDMSRTPLFDVLIILQNTDMSNDNRSLQLSDVIVSSYDQGEMKVSKFDLSFTFTEMENELQLAIEYNSDLFYKSTIKRMANHLEYVLQAAINDPEKPLQQIDLVKENEKKQLLYDYNKTQFSYPEGHTLIALFEEQVDKNPSSIALIVNNKRITYAQLNEKANQFGHYLRQQYSIQPDDLVALKVERSDLMLIWILGVLKSGGAYIPIDPAYPEERILYILEDSKCKLVIDAEELKKFDFEKNKLPSTNLSLVNKPQDLIYVIYTSGSTGQPKGVMLEHKNVVSFFTNLEQQFGFTQNAVVGAATNYTFDISVLELLGTLVTGGAVVLINTTDPQETFALIEENKIDILQLTPSRLNLLLESDPELRKLQNLKTLLIGGEALPVAHYNSVKKLINTNVFNVYGPTETTIWSTSLNIKNSDKLSIGKPLLNETVYILDNQLCLLPIGIPGELCIGGVGVARGYLNRPELTQEKFIPNPFEKEDRIYKTGDIARWLPDGSIEYIGRRDQQVKVRGYRIELGEIENVLQSYPSLLSAVVTVGKDVSGENILVAYIVAEKEQDTSLLKKFLGSKVPAYMIPDQFIILDKMPLNANGKADRNALQDVKGSAQLSKSEYVAPRNETEYKLATIWEAILGIEKAGVMDDFFDLGGHSLRATRLANRIQKEFNVKVSLKELFENPVLEEQAAFIGIKQWKQNNQLEIINTSEEEDTEIHTF